MLSCCMLDREIEMFTYYVPLRDQTMLYTHQPPLIKLTWPCKRANIASSLHPISAHFPTSCCDNRTHIVFPLVIHVDKPQYQFT